MFTSLLYTCLTLAGSVVWFIFRQRKGLRIDYIKGLRIDNMDASRPEDNKITKEFHQFSELNDDLCRTILSFVGDAPHEQRLPGPLVYRYRPSSLTTSLPLVSKQFHSFTNLDDYWEPALLRQLKKGTIWKEGLKRLLPPNHQGHQDAEGMLKSTRQYLCETVSCKEIYRKIFTHHLQFSGAIFIMPCQIRLGEMYGLHLFEPRYRIMIQELMDSCENPEEARHGGTIRARTVDGVVQPPLLIHACEGSRLGPGEKACLVQVLQCDTYEYGTADVRFLPVAWVKLERIWVRPSSGHLFYGKATRILV
jgi:hypothetical protein